MMTAMRDDEDAFEGILLDLGAGAVVDGTCRLHRAAKDKTRHRCQGNQRRAVGAQGIKLAAINHTKERPFIRRQLIQSCSNLLGQQRKPLNTPLIETTAIQWRPHIGNRGWIQKSRSAGCDKLGPDASNQHIRPKNLMVIAKPMIADDDDHRTITGAAALDGFQHQADIMVVRGHGKPNGIPFPALLVFHAVYRSQVHRVRVIRSSE